MTIGVIPNESGIQIIRHVPNIVSGLSFIPGVGIPFGIIAIIWGIVTKKEGGKKLAIIGSAGILLSMILYSALFYFGFMQRGGQYDELRAKLTVNMATQTVQAIEFYKTKHGNYPKNLSQLSSSLPEASLYIVNDPSNVQFGGQPRQFYYQLVNSSQYYLFSVGPDNVPFTKDDILPCIQPGGGIGYSIRP